MINRKLWLKASIKVLGCGMLSLFWVSTSFADNCDDLDNNEQWTSEFAQLNDAYKQKDWGSALNHAKTLEEICDLSPALNYTIAHIHKEKGDQEKYLFYLQKSTQNTERFAVDKNLLDQMWSEKYIATHPEAAPEQLTVKDDRIRILQNNLVAANQKIANLQATHQSGSKELARNESQSAYQAMWIGAGVGIAGLALTGVGAALVASYEPGQPEKIETDRTKGNDSQQSLGFYYKYTKEPLYSFGWALVGAGAAMSVIGTILAGIYGYQYTHSQSQVLSFSVSSNEVSFVWTF